MPTLPWEAPAFAPWGQSWLPKGLRRPETGGAEGLGTGSRGGLARPSHPPGPTSGPGKGGCWSARTLAEKEGRRGGESLNFRLGHIPSVDPRPRDPEPVLSPRSPASPLGRQ